MIRLLDTLPPALRNPLRSPGYDFSWCPFYPVREGYTRYWQTAVDVAVLQHELKHSDTPLATLETMDQYMPRMALMEATRTFDDASLEDTDTIIGPGPHCAMTTRALPDVCDLVPYLAYWGDVAEGLDPDRHAIAVLLSRALPNPCKSRALDTGLAHDLRKGGEMIRDIVLRVLFACILGVYPGNEVRLCPDARILAYHAFVLVPPSPEMLADFVRQHKMFLVAAFREFVFFSIDQVPAVRDYMAATYAWDTMRDITRETTDAVRALINERAKDFGFLNDPEIWRDVEMKASANHQRVLKHVYRSACAPFYVTMLAEYGALTGKNKEPAPTIEQYRDAHAYAAHFKPPPSMSLEYPLTDPERWGRLPEPFHSQMANAVRLYNTETNLTACRKLLAKLYDADRRAYDDFYAYLTACKWRLGLRWQPLPAQWAERQAEALCRRYGDAPILPDYAGVYFVCPKCLEIRSPPMHHDTSADKKRYGGFFAKQVCLWVDGLSVKLVCKARNKRKQDAREKRNRRNNPDASNTKSKHQMCNGTELIRVYMVGVLLYTERDKLLALCVHCGVLIKWEAAAMTPDGPSCGCHEAAKPKPDPRHQCVICEHTTDRIAWHPLLTENGIEEVPICTSHRTSWLKRVQTHPSLAEVKQAVLSEQRSAYIAGRRIVVHRKTKH